MGVDFKHGCMSYARYDRFVCVLAKSFGGKPNIYIPDFSPNENGEVFIYPFGFIECGENNNVKEKFTFDIEVPEVIVKYCNAPYGELKLEETKELYHIMNKNRNQLLSHESDDDSGTVDQIIKEFWHYTDDGVGWYTL